MGQSYDVEDVITDQLAGVSAPRVAADAMSALQGHESEALVLLAERISVRLTQIGKVSLTRPSPST